MENPENLKFLDLFNNSISNSFYVEEAWRIVERASVILKDPESPDKKGGFLAICDSQTGTLATMQIGTIGSDEKKRLYMRYATEKATRLYMNYETFRSFETKDESKNHFGGGVHIHACNLIVAFSAFKEKVDEAISVAYGSFCSVVNGQEYTQKDLPYIYAKIYEFITESTRERFKDNMEIYKLAHDLYR